MRLRVNDTDYRVSDAWRQETLLDTLREHLGLVGAKFSCGIGVCGACRVHVDGVPWNSCTLMTGQAEGRAIRTVEGLAARDGSLHPVQRAWLEERVPQCGFCQAGQIMQAVALLERSPDPSDDEIAAAMAGQLCRCGTYDRIRRAIRRVAASGGVAEARTDG